MAEFLTAAEAARLAGLSRSRIYAAIKSGKLQTAPEVSGNVRLLRREDVSAWASRRKSLGGRPRKQDETTGAGEST